MIPPIALDPKDEALFKAFIAVQVRHRRQADAFEEVWRSLGQALLAREQRPVGEGEITVLYGPTGVGKTSLWLKLRERAETLDRQRALRGSTPHLYVLADVPPSGTVRMKPFYVATLLEANEVLVKYKRVFTPGPDRPASWTATEAGLRQATLNMLKHRQPVVLCIDEAHHLASHSTEAQRAKNLDAIKAFADLTSVPLLLMGTYELAEFSSTSGRLGRRVREIHLPRYALDRADDRREFRGVIAFLAKRLPLQGYDMVADRAYLHERAQGCVGVLKQWCERALYRALSQGRPCICEDDMRAEEPKLATVNQWAAETSRGEARVRELHALPGVVVNDRASQPRNARPFRRARIADPVGPRSAADDPGRAA